MNQRRWLPGCDKAGKSHTSSLQIYIMVIVNWASHVKGQTSMLKPFIASAWGVGERRGIWGLWSGEEIGGDERGGVIGANQSNKCNTSARVAAKIWTYTMMLANQMRALPSSTMPPKFERFLRNGADTSQSSASSICVRVAAKIWMFDAEC